VRPTLTAAKRLVIKELPLWSFTTLAQAQALNANDGSGWVQAWVTERRAERGAVETTGRCATWACPLRQRALWSSAGMVVPDPARTRAVFGQVAPGSCIGRQRIEKTIGLAVVLRGPARQIEPAEP
jgi:hypothetical protein